MYPSPPFHRRILPWIFVLIFCAVAPAVLFYTAGYRWNTKKEKVERNGTLIIDSRPSGAAVFLNGKDSTETTPITFQNVPPGRYHIHVEKDAYHPWDKELDIRPELVTFANTIQLWKKTPPEFIRETTSTHLLSSPTQKTLVFVSPLAQQTEIVLASVHGTIQKTHRLPAVLHEPLKTNWSEDGRAFILSGNSSSSQSWLVSVTDLRDPLLLPSGVYRWDGSRLDGVSGSNKIIINTSNRSLVRLPLPPHTLDQFQNITLQQSTSSDAIVLFQDSALSQGYVLPRGNWRIAKLERRQVLLQEGERWMNVDLEPDVPTIHRVQGDMLRISEDGIVPRSLTLHDGEVWIWDFCIDPQLILRQSDTMITGAWLSTGNDIAFATSQDLRAINLDERSGYLQTPLAKFDRITDITVVKNTIFILGTKDGKTGLWRLEI